MQRYGSVIKLKPEKLEEYKALHANPWPEVLRMIHACNIRNYTIWRDIQILFIQTVPAVVKGRGAY